MLRAVLLAFDGVLVTRAEAKPVTVVPGARSFLQSLAERGWMIGVVGFTRPHEIHSVLQQARLSEFVKVVTSSDGPHRRSPAARAYIRALEDFNSLPPLPDRLVHPHEVLALETNEDGIAAAAEAGLAVARITANDLAQLTAEGVALLYRGQE